MSKGLEISIELIAACLDNNRQAQRQLYDMLLPYLNIICKRYLRNPSDVQDVLQETFIRIFNNLDKYDIEKAGFKTWATRIAINCCLRKNEKRQKQSTEELIIDLHEPKVSPQILEALSNDELLKWLKKMPKNYYEVFNLYIIDDFSHEEIANILNIDASLSRKRLSRSRAWLKKNLKGEWALLFKLSSN